MRILYLTYSFASPEQPGSIRAWQVGHFLKEKGHHVTVITCERNYMDGSVRDNALGSAKYPRSNLSVERIRVPIGNPRKTPFHRILHDSIFSFVQAIRCLVIIKNIDLILSASPPILTPFFACLLSRLTGVKHIFEVRDILSEGLISGDIIKQKKLVGIIAGIESYCFRNNNGLIAVTPGIQRYLLRKGISGAHVKLITNGVEDQLFRIPVNGKEARNLWRVPPDAFVVLFAGTLSSFSYVEVLLSCAFLLRHDQQIYFVIAGEGQKRAEYEEYCLENNMTNVVFPGSVARKNIPGLCAMADVCVHMFRKGPFWDIFLSNKLFDYLGAGKPVIYSGGGDGASLIRDCSGGIVVESDSPEAIKQAILKLRSQPELRVSMGNTGRAYVLEHYSRKMLLGRLERHLCQIVEA